MPFPNRAYLDENVVTGDDVDLGADTNLLAALLVSHLLARVSFPHKHEHKHAAYIHSGGRGTDERDAELVEHAGKVRTLGEEAIAGVHSVCSSGLDGSRIPVDIQIALHRRRGAEQKLLVGKAHVQLCGRC